MTSKECLAEIKAMMFERSLPFSDSEMEALDFAIKVVRAAAAPEIVSATPRDGEGDIYDRSHGSRERRQDVVRTERPGADDGSEVARAADSVHSALDRREDAGVECRAAAPVAWLGKVDQGMGHWHFEIAEPHAPNAFPVYRVNPVAAAQGPTREELAEALRGCLNDDTGDWVDNAMDLLARHVASKGEPAEIGGEET